MASISTPTPRHRHSRLISNSASSKNTHLRTGQHLPTRRMNGLLQRRRASMLPVEHIPELTILLTNLCSLSHPKVSHDTLNATFLALNQYPVRTETGHPSRTSNDSALKSFLGLALSIEELDFGPNCMPFVLRRFPLLRREMSLQAGIPSNELACPSPSFYLSKTVQVVGNMDKGRISPFSSIIGMPKKKRRDRPV